MGICFPNHERHCLHCVQTNRVSISVSHQRLRHCLHCVQTNRVKYQCITSEVEAAPSASPISPRVITKYSKSNAHSFHIIANPIN